MKKKLSFLFFSALTVFLLTVSFDSRSFWWFSLFGLVPFLTLVHRSKNKKRAFLGGWFVGLVFFLFNLEWFLGPHYAWWGGSKDLFFSLLVFSFAWLGSATVLGLSFGVFAIVFKRINKVPKIKFSAVLFSSIWILLEYLRAWLFCFWSWGSESIFGPYWTFGHLGYTLVNSPASVLARYGGLYGLSFLVIFINVLIFQKRIRFLVVFLFIVFIFVPLVAPDYSSDKVLIADILQAENSDVYYSTVIGFLKDNPLPNNSSQLLRVVVFPEGSNFFSTEAHEADILLPFLFGGEEEGLIVSSAVFKEGDSKYEDIIYVDKEGNILERQKKRFLVAAGEYMPYVIFGPLKLFSFEKQISAFNLSRHFNKGDEAEKPFYFEDTKFGSLACSGILSPVFYKRLASDGAEVLVNSSSHQTFGYSEQGLFHVKTFARFQAIANARPFLQSVFGGYAFIVDANGNFVASNFVKGTKFVSGEIRPIEKKTLYTRLGDWPLLVALLFVFWGVYFWLIMRVNNITLK